MDIFVKKKDAQEIDRVRKVIVKVQCFK